MGTRNITAIIKDNQIKLSQYGQWDGYFAGQGKTVTEFIRNNLKTDRRIKWFSEKVDLLKQVDNNTYDNYIKAYEGINKNREFAVPFSHTFPQFSRDTGADILNIINRLQDYEYNYKNKRYPVYIEDDYCCIEFIYCIDLDTQEVYMLTDWEFDASQIKEIPNTIAQTYNGFNCWYKSKLKDLASVKTIQKYFNELFNEGEQQ